MQDFFQGAWNFQYALLPCLTAYLIFDFPIIIRRFTRKVYVPIYFAFFPTGYSDELLAKYFDEDYFGQLGEPLAPSKMKSARLKIIAVSMASLTLTMSISPLIAGYCGSVFLSESQFTQFLWTLGIIKAILLLWSLYDLRFGFRIHKRVPPLTLTIIYICYWAALLYFTVSAKDWVDTKYAVGGTVAVIQGVLDFLIWEIGVGIVFVAVAGAVIGWWITDTTSDSDA